MCRGSIAQHGAQYGEPDGEPGFWQAGRWHPDVTMLETLAQDIDSLQPASAAAVANGVVAVLAAACTPCRLRAAAGLRLDRLSPSQIRRLIRPAACGDPCCRSHHRGPSSNCHTATCTAPVQSEPTPWPLHLEPPPRRLPARLLDPARTATALQPSPSATASTTPPTSAAASAGASGFARDYRSSRHEVHVATPMSRITNT